MHRNGYRNITLYPMALGDTTGHILFASFISSNGGLLPSEHDSLTNPTCLVVPITRLDDMVRERVDCIKIDVEGAEGLAMKGAAGLIDAHRPIVTSEFSMEMLPRVSGMPGIEYLRFFIDRGYHAHMIHRETLELVPIPDVGAFLEGYGEPTRIEDLAFLP